MALNTLNQKVIPRLVTVLTATGSNQATAYPLANNAEHEFTTVPGGSGCVLPVAELPSIISVYNSSGTPLAVYPAPGGTINSGAVNSPISLAAGTGVTWWGSSLSNWYAVQTSSTGGGGGTPGGGNAQLQFNNAGVFGGFTASGDAIINTSTGVVTVTKTGGVVFAPSATTDTTIATNITSGTLPAAQLPVPTASTLGGVESILPVSHKWINTISVAGVPALTQPSFSDISGQVVTAQLANASVIYATIQNVAAASLVGNPTVGSANAQGITLGANLSFSGTTLVAAGGSTPGGSANQVQYNSAGVLGGFTVGGDATLNAGTGALTIGAGAITLAKQASFAASALMGNPTGSGATPSAITLGANLSFSGTTLVAATGMAANPGGSSNQVQFNSAGTAFGGFTMSGDATLVVATGVITVTGTSGVAFAASATTNALNAANISAGTLPAARLPVPSASTLGGVQSYAAVSHQWINTINTSGVPSSTQPAFTDISGAITAGQLPALTATDIWVGNGSNVATAVAVSGDGTLSNAGALTITKTAGVAFASSATTNALNASNISSGTLPAGRMPALTGAVTTSAGAVATTLAAAAVSYANIQNVAAFSLLGNSTGSPASPLEITLGANLSFVGSTLVASGGGAPAYGSNSFDATFSGAL